MSNSLEIQAFCKNVKGLRVKYNLTKKRMSSLLGIGIKTLNKIEEGILPARLSAGVIIKVSITFEISPSQLFSEME